MSRELSRWLKLSEPKPRKPSKPTRPPQEERALKILQAEAKKAGTHLDTGGEGGLSPSLVLGVMRRDHWLCRVCKSNKRITVHHIGGIVGNEYMSALGHLNKPHNLATLCASCHDRLHNKARALGIDSSQVDAKGDK